MTYETDPIKMERMEAEARQLINTLTTKQNNPYWGVFLIVGVIFVSFAVIKSPFDPNFPEGFWDIVSVFGLIFLVFIFCRGAQIYSTQIQFDGFGIRFRRWIFGTEQSYNWNEVLEKKSIWLGVMFSMSDGNSIKFSSEDAFGIKLYDAHNIFAARYSLEED